MTEGRLARIKWLVFATLFAAFAVPTAIVFTVELLAKSGRETIARETEAAALEAAESHLDTDKSIADLRAIAARHEVRLWLVDPVNKHTYFDSDHQSGASDLGLSSMPYVDRSDTVDAFERGRVAPPLREHVLLAARDGKSAGCSTFAEEKLLVCEAAMRTRGKRIVLAQRAAPRITSRLTDAREGLFLVGGGVLLAGLALAAWLVRRLARPLDALHGQVNARASGASTTIAIPNAPREIADVAHAVDDLATRLEELRRRDAAAAADLAHELKSPLARIKLALDAGEVSDEARTTLDKNARAAVVAIDRTVGDLLEIARAEAGLRDDERTATDLLALVEQVVADRPPPSHISVEVTGSPTTARVAPAAVTRALGQLLDNAYAHAESRVRLAVGDDASVTIRDDGPGVPDEIRERLFERFVSARPGGNGLGLAFVRAVAEAHGGAAELVQSSSPGAVFVIHLARG